jgi:hypothetical protein
MGKRRRRKKTHLGRSKRRVGEWGKYAARRSMDQDHEQRKAQEIIAKADTGLTESNMSGSSTLHGTDADEVHYLQ